jgi:hypothetical protein
MGGSAENRAAPFPPRREAAGQDSAKPPITSGRRETIVEEALGPIRLTHEITDLERQTMARLVRRLVPLLMAC